MGRFTLYLFTVIHKEITQIDDGVTDGKNHPITQQLSNAEITIEVPPKVRNSDREKQHQTQQVEHC
jgi:hypothetical protein